jgi:hypothetical protein
MAADDDRCVFNPSPRGAAMDVNFDPALVRLSKGAVRSHVGQRGHGIAVFEGRVWVTQDNDWRDFVLDAGESLAVERHGRVVVQALSDASLLLLGSADGEAGIEID